MRSYDLKFMKTYSFKETCNGLQGAVAQYAANQTRKTGANPFYRLSAMGYFTCVYNTRDQRLYVPSEGRGIMVKSLIA